MLPPSEAEPCSPNFKETLQNAAELQAGTDLQEGELHRCGTDIASTEMWAWDFLALQAF